MSGNARKALRRTKVLGLAAVLLLVGGVGGWAAVTEIAGAVIAPAVVVVDTSAKKVQTLDGGIIRELTVREGDRVDAGQELARLDDAETRAALGVLDSQIAELAIGKARLEAAQLDTERIEIPTLLAGRTGDASVSHILDVQQTLLDRRRQSLKGTQDQLRDRIKQLEDQIGGLRSQIEAKKQQQEVVSRERESLRSLEKKRLVQQTRVLALEREVAQLGGDVGQLEGDIARLGGAISETGLKIVQAEDEQRATDLAEMNEVRTRLSSLLEQKVAAEAKLARTTVLAPQAGIVHQLAVHTIGGVVTPGEPLMLIVPEGDELVLEARVRPQDIDQVTSGQAATIRFPGFEGRLIPNVDGVVERVGADLSVDQKSGESFFTIRLTIPKGEIAKLGGGRGLRPGLPAEVYIQTRMRTALAYLVEPIADQLRHAFRD